MINGFTSKLAAGVTFNINSINSGKVVCGSKEYPTKIYIYVDNGTGCAGKPENNFEFNGWVENLPSKPNTTIPVSNPSGNLTINKYGTFTANFKPLPPTIPPQYLAPLYGIIITSIIGWSIPSIIGWVRTKVQRNNLKECLDEIGKLDRSTIEEKIVRYYIDGKISESYHKLLKDKIAEYYENR